MTAVTGVPVAGWASLLVGVFWVSTVVGLVLGVVWRRVEDPRLRRRLQWAGSLLFFVPQVPVMVAWNAAAPLVTLQRVLLGMWLLSSAAVALVALRRQAGGRRGRMVTVLVALGMTAGGLALAAPAVWNVTAPPVPLAGRVIQASAGYGTYAPVLDIGGRRFRVTRDMARHLRIGMQVEGLALGGTRHIVRLHVLHP